jgi:2-phosphoglycerate kinase
MEKRRIILIGGAPVTGKSILAKKISDEYGIPWISTDVIRSWMKTIVSKDKFPHLFNFTNITAEEHYKKHSVEETIKFEKLRDQEVFKGIKTFIEKNDDWKLCVIEGISIHPKFISKLKSEEYEIYPIFLVDNDKNRIKEILFERGLWGDADSYEDWVKDIEEEYLVKTNQYYMKECEKYNLKCFEIEEKRQESTKKVFKYLDSKLGI